MAQFFTGNDLYNDLFLNNDREMYIKMLLLDIDEPEITEFFIRTSDDNTTLTGASQMLVKYDSNIEDGDYIECNAADLDVARGTTVAWGVTYTYIITGRTMRGTLGNTYATISNNTSLTAGMGVTATSLFSGTNTIKEVYGNTIYFTNPMTATVTSAACTVYTGITYGYLKLKNFVTNRINTYSQQYLSSGIWGITNPGVYYKSNKYNKLIVSKKEIQGYVTTGSLKVDGNSAMRRTIDFSCIVDKDFGDASGLKLHDFDNKKIKILIGIKDSQITTYDYNQYFTDNGTQKDENDIVWFKLGVFIPRNITIKHSVDSFLISVSAQDKMSSLDGSFGGILGTGLEFKNTDSGENISFYDTILDSVQDYGKESASKISIKLADDFSLFKYPTSIPDYYVTNGSSLLYVSNADNLSIGMEIEAPGVYNGTKISGISLGSQYATIIMDYPAYDSILATQFIYKNDIQITNGATFKSPSYKNYFAIEPLVAKSSPQPIYLKSTTIQLKGTTYTYGASGNIYTTISDWSPGTWGNQIIDSKKQYYTQPLDSTIINIIKQDPITGEFTSDNANIAVGDVLITRSSIGNLDALGAYQIYKIYSKSSSNTFKLTVASTSGAVLVTIPGTEAKVDTIPVLRTSTIYESFIASGKAILATNYNKYSKRFDVASYIASDNILLISRYDQFSNNSSVQTSFYDFFLGAPSYPSVTAVASTNNGYYVADKDGECIIGKAGAAGVGKDSLKSTAYGPDWFQSNFNIYTYSVGMTLCVTNKGLGLEKKSYIVTDYYDDGSHQYIKLAFTDTNAPVSPNTNDPFGLYPHVRRVDGYVSNIIGEVTSMHITAGGSLLVASTGNNISKYLLPTTPGGTPILKQTAKLTQNCTCLASDSSENAYALLSNENNIVKLNSDLSKRINSVSLSSFWSNLISETNVLAYPVIESFSVDENDNLFAITGGTFTYGTIASPQTKNVGKNIILIDTNTLLPTKSIEFFDSLADYSNSLISRNDIFFYPRNRTPNISLNQLPLTTTVLMTEPIAIREFSPQTSNTIQKSGSDSVTSILEDVKSQLGSFQYYYDYDGNFIFKEDKRLSFSDPTYNITNPYSFNFENYSLNVDEIPFEYDFIKNIDLVSEYNNSTDLSAFKNDFFVHGSKKGLDYADENKNIPMLYHIMIDDLSLKDTPSTFLHPWQQYIVDQGISGTTYANFLYYNELKTNFPFIPSRDYIAGSTVTYVTGEFILVNNTLTGASSASSYSLYEVLAGGTPSNGYFPFKKDGSREYLNPELPSNTGLAVRYYSNVFGYDYEKYQGIYSKIFDGSANPDTQFAMRAGSYFIATSNGKKWIYQITSIYYYSAIDGSRVEVASPISIKISSLGLSDTFIGKTYTKQLDSGVDIELGGLSTCYIEIKNINIFDKGYLGIFRKDNTGAYTSDFDISNMSGDPGSWTYYYDIVNIAGKYTQNFQFNKNIPVGVTYWKANTFYDTNSFVYSDDKIYQAIIGGTSGGVAPSGFGTSYGIIKDTSVLFSNLTWKLSQISTDLTKLKVSAIGSRKSAIYDKDINTLFSPKEALSFFKTEGFYFVILHDLLNYEMYPESFHNKLEALIKQFTILYPNIKLVFIPESQASSLFYTSKLTSLKDAFSVVKKNFYLNFINGQSINISCIPIYNIEPLGLIKIKDESSDLYGNFLLTDFVVPLSNEGFLTMTGVKTHPYKETVSTLPDWVLRLGKYTTPGSSYAYDYTANPEDRVYQ